MTAASGPEAGHGRGDEAISEHYVLLPGVQDDAEGGVDGVEIVKVAERDDGTDPYVELAAEMGARSARRCRSAQSLHRTR